MEFTLKDVERIYGCVGVVIESGKNGEGDRYFSFINRTYVCYKDKSIWKFNWLDDGGENCTRHGHSYRVDKYSFFYWKNMRLL